MRGGAGGGAELAVRAVRPEGHDSGLRLLHPEAEEEALPQDEIASTPPKEVTPSPDNAAASPADDVPPDDDAAAPPEESSSPTTASITQGEDGAPDEGDPPLEDAESKDVAPFDEETLPLEDGAVPLLENVPWLVLLKIWKQALGGGGFLVLPQ